MTYMHSEPYLIPYLLPGESTAEIDLVPIRQFLQGGDDRVLGQRGLNLRPLKKAVAMLPNYAKANESTKSTLDEVHAILFHSQTAIRTYVAKEWFNEQYGALPGQGLNVDFAAILGLPSRPTIRRR